MSSKYYGEPLAHTVGGNGMDKLINMSCVSHEIYSIGNKEDEVNFSSYNNKQVSHRGFCCMDLVMVRVLLE